MNAVPNVVQFTRPMPVTNASCCNGNVRCPKCAREALEAVAQSRGGFLGNTTPVMVHNSTEASDHERAQIEAMTPPVLNFRKERQQKQQQKPERRVLGRDIDTIGDEFLYS